MIIPGQFGFNCPSGFKGKAVSEIGSKRNEQFPEDLP
jgi:hypothetical protein